MALGRALVASTFALILLPAAAGHWLAPALALAPTPAASLEEDLHEGPGLAPRAPSPGDLALEGGDGERLPPRDRLIALEDPSSREKATFNIGPGGYVRFDQTIALQRFFRCRHTGRHAPVDLRLLALLADISEHWPGRVIEFLSGLRTPPNGAPHSRHYTGHALDFRLRGVPSTAVRDFVWREYKAVGVGYYPDGDFVHLDSRPGQPATAWSRPGDESTSLQYHPQWASRGL